MQLYFDYSCPYAYLASFVAERAARLRGEALEWRPMLLGGVFRAVGTAQNLMGELAAAKAAHNLADMQRWARLLDVPLTIPEGHPFRTVEALRATLLTRCDPRVIQGFYRAYWQRGEPVSSEPVLTSVLRDAGYDPAGILARLGSEEVKSELRARTDEAIARGVFGAPAFVIGAAGDEQLYWGVDRLQLISGHDFATTYGVGAPSKYTARMPTLDLYWDFSSPFAYLGTTQAEALAARTGATLRWQPMLLGGLFRAIGQVDAPILTWSEAKRDHSMRALLRWADFYGVPFRFPSKFPINSVKALRCWLALPEAARGAFREKTFRAYWAEGKDINDDAVLADLIGEGASAVLARTQEAEIKQQLISATERAKERGVFGAPTWIVDERELFWGQDRIPLVERALLAAR